MKFTNLKITDLINEKAKLTFLVGAGCSIDAPSCLPAGRRMMEAIVEDICAESEFDKILKIEALRFEALVEIVRDRFDKGLKIIDYYSQCDKPNIQHFFLAQMIKKGHFVLTTNFDFLIEYALLQLKIPKKNIIPVITQNDFKKFSNPIELSKKGNLLIYKVHGSTKNIITGEDTRNSLITTIRAFGTNKEGLNVFQVEPYKRPVFEKISKGRSLVVLGYSGSDDFDIVPTLKVLKDLDKIIWIKHVKDDDGIPKIYEIDEIRTQNLSNMSKEANILLDIKRLNNNINIYLVEANTSRLIESLIDFTPNLSQIDFNVNLTEWLEKNIEQPSKLMKYLIPSKIYFEFNEYDDVLRCSNEVIRIAQEINDQNSKAIALNDVGSIYFNQGDYSEALKNFKEALNISEKQQDFTAKSEYLNNIGNIFLKQGVNDKALNYFKEAFKIDKQENDVIGKTIRLNNIGNIYHNQGNYSKALKYYEKALKIDEKIGDLKGKAIRLNNIGKLYQDQGKYVEALKNYEEALEIDENLGNFIGKAIRLNNIGLIHQEQKNFSKALEFYKNAFNIDEKLNDKYGMAARLNNIGTLFHSQENYPEALKYYQEALKIDRDLNNLKEIGIRLSNIGVVYKELGNTIDALKNYEEALEIAQKLNDLSGKASRLFNIGGIYYEQKNYSEALKYFENSLEIETKIKNLKNKAYALEKIGLIHYHLGDSNKALKIFEEALQILNQIGLVKEPITLNIKENIKFLKDSN